MRGPAAIEVFLSYSHRDKKVRQELETQLAVLNRQLSTTWHDGRLLPGDEWDPAILARLDAAKLILLLISANFLDSKPCQAEMIRAIERHEAGETTVVPVILKPCDWQNAPAGAQGSGPALLGRFQALPEGEKPIIKWEPREEGYLSVVQGVRRRVEALLGGEVAAGSARATPAVRRSAVAKDYFNNLPQPTTPFIGRKQERAEIRRLLGATDTRLLVLLGPGGVGKTRLAYRVAADLEKRFENGVCQVRLDRVRSPGAVLPTLAKALGLREAEDVGIEESLARHLEAKRMLLVLDTFEHVAAAGEQVAALLEGCPGLKVLVTSRSRLNIIGEQNFQVPLLKVPRGILKASDLSQYDAVQLFIQRAKAVKPDFAVNDQNAPAVADICVRLEGLALAIELAAARISRFSPRRMLEELKRQLLHVLEDDAKGARERQTAMEATINWSYKLLRPEEKSLFRRLSVFGGGCTVDSAAALFLTPAAGSRSLGQLEAGLEALVDNNLLRQEEQNGEYRFRMLDVMREYAQEHLQEDEGQEPWRRRHAELFVRLAEEAEAKIQSAERSDWLDRLDAEHVNLQIAFEWSQAEDPDLGLRLAGALFWFWNMRGYFVEGRDWLERALARTSASPTEPSAARAQALYGVGGLAFLQGDHELARPWLTESTDLWRALEDQRRLGYALIIQGMVALGENDFDVALACEEESVEIFRQLNEEWGYALALNDLGNVYRARGDHAKAAELYDQSLERWRRRKDGWGIPLTLSNVGFLEMVFGASAKARQAFEEAAKIQRREKDRWGLGESLKYLADLAVREGKLADAEQLYRDGLVLNQEIGRKPFMVGCLAGLAVLAGRSGRVEHAARLIGATDALRGPVRVHTKAIDHSMYTAVVDDLRAKFSERFEAGYREGHEMSLTQAVSYALDRLAT